MNPGDVAQVVLAVSGTSAVAAIITAIITRKKTAADVQTVRASASDVLAEAATKLIDPYVRQSEWQQRQIRALYEDRAHLVEVINAMAETMREAGLSVPEIPALPRMEPPPQPPAPTTVAPAG